MIPVTGAPVYKVPQGLCETGTDKRGRGRESRMPVWSHFPPAQIRVLPLVLEFLEESSRSTVIQLQEHLCNPVNPLYTLRQAGVGALPPHEGPEPGYIACSFCVFRVRSSTRYPSPVPPASIGPKLKPTHGICLVHTTPSGANPTQA